ncbi:MAG: FKBP-type peptidyl-prolyl cis-trans isomerase [Salinivirgaceae bacterium]|nr:FKBP-type peptidyl-prolyl cis-trans isomerase [Salinivirgaceae bacterium]
MKIFNLLIAVFCFSICVSCGSKFKIDDSGLSFKFIIENTDNQKPIEGDVLSIKFKYTDASGNVIEESDLFRTQLKKPSHEGGSIEDALAMMHKGDSAIFLIKAKSYYTKSRKESLPERFNSDAMLTFYIKLVDIKSYEDFKTERQTHYISGEKYEERMLNEFLEKTNITIEPTTSGMYVLELRKGTGKKPEPGKKVSVHYMGYFIDGNIFDSSYEREKPYIFRYGLGEVIQGWDEGLSYMNVGGKYKLVIPSHLAYGGVQNGPIPPYTTLIFEIELLETE